MASPGSDKAPAVDGRGASFLDFRRQMRQWVRPTKTELSVRASLVAPLTQRAPRQVCPAEGGGALDRHDGLSRILDFLRMFFAWRAVGAIHRPMALFANCLRSGQSVDEYFAEFDLLRRKAAPKLAMCAGYPERPISTLRMKNAALSRREKSLAMASSHKGLKFEDAAANARRFLESRGEVAATTDCSQERQ